LQPNAYLNDLIMAGVILLCCNRFNTFAMHKQRVARNIMYLLCNWAPMLPIITRGNKRAPPLPC